MSDYIKTNFHTHTTFCDGKNTPEEMVQAALECGIQRLGFSPHTLYPFYTEGNLLPERHAAYTNEIRRLKASFADRIQILQGFEADYIPGLCAPHFDRFAAYTPDFLIGSVHFLMNPTRLFAVDNTPAELVQGLRDIFSGDIRQLVGAYFSAERDMLASGDFTIIGHADLVRKFNSALRLFDENDAWYKREVQATAQAIARAGVLAEINTGGIARGHIETPYPSAYFLSLLHEQNVPIIINSDAHFASGIDFAFDVARTVAKRAGYTETAYLGDGGSISFCAL